MLWRESLPVRSSERPEISPEQKEGETSLWNRQGRHCLTWWPKPDWRSWRAGRLTISSRIGGITRSKHVAGNDAIFDAVLEFLDEGYPGLIFANLIDFDMKWGHRNDVEGFARGLEHIDTRLPELLSSLGEHDLLTICADHGNDPTTPSTDHSREYVPVIAYSPARARKGLPGRFLGVRQTFADLGATVADFLGVPWALAGESFLRQIL